MPSQSKPTITITQQHPTALQLPTLRLQCFVPTPDIKNLTKKAA